MTDDELREFGAIRERLRALDQRLSQHETDSRKRAEQAEEDIRELGKTVARLSEAIAGMSVRMGTTPAPVGGALVAGQGLAGIMGAAVAWIVARLMGG